MPSIILVVCPFENYSPLLSIHFDITNIIYVQIKNIWVVVQRPGEMWIASNSILFYRKLKFII